MVETAGHSQAEEVYRSDRERLVRVAFMLVGSQEVAEDLVQEAFTQTWARLDYVANPVAYVRQTVVNLCRKHHRRQGVESRHAPRPPGTALAAEVDETWDALWRLPERQRAALVLRYYEDLDVAGVAHALGCRLGTAKSLVHRGLGALKTMVEAP